MICRGNLNVWIAAEFDWKFQSSDVANTTVDLTEIKSKKDTQSLAKFTIEMTLSKRRIPKLGYVDMKDYHINEELLTDEAFVSKTYLVSLEKGNFLTSFDLMLEDMPELTSRWHTRLNFEPSPFPPLEEWKDDPSDRFWEWKTFCAREREPEPASKGICIVQ